MPECLTPCDDDCVAECHEGHMPAWKRELDHTHAKYIDIDPDKCCVGRALCNDSLPGWMIPCNAEPTEECVLPNGLILPLCKCHNDIWKEVLQTASEAVAREQQRQEMHTLQ